MDEEIKYNTGEEVVFCPKTPYARHRGADGTIISRNVSSSKNAKGEKKVRSILVRWNLHRKGVSCFRVSGKVRAKSDTMKAHCDGFNRIASLISEADVQMRYEESAIDLHPLSYCHECPLRLHRLMGSCKRIKQTL